MASLSTPRVGALQTKPLSADATYESVTRIIGEQPDGLAWLILDARLDTIANWKRAVRSDQPPVEAPTIEALAWKKSACPQPSWRNGSAPSTPPAPKARASAPKNRMGSPPGRG
ncbi:MAG: hypothetical protein R3D67_06535 [Hyphomicrobiaceae bacterium]